MEDLQALLGEIPSGILWTISPDDATYRCNPKDYVDLALGALRCIRLALLAAHKSSVARILDFPSSYGRVLRVLKAAFPEATLTACDNNHGAVDFCAATFGAVPVYGREPPEKIPLPNRFDLIWCGEFFGRFDQNRWPALLNMLASRLAPGGLLLFTTNGRCVVDKTREDKRQFGLGQEALAAMLDSYQRSGFGYANVPGEGIGVALSSPAWVCSLIDRATTLRLLSFMERGWTHQDRAGREDCIACIRDVDPPGAAVDRPKNDQVKSDPG